MRVLSGPWPRVFPGLSRLSLFSRGSGVNWMSDVRRPAAVNMLPVGGDRDANRCNKSPEEDQKSGSDQRLGIPKKRRRTDFDKSHKEPQRT